jgi:putative IMPACT (imprinted ancient) family translation regulator
MDKLTIKNSALAEKKVLSSRFIALLDPCVNEEVFEQNLALAHKAYPKATHYCYAYRLAKEEGFSDDGEPSRSVGLPLLTYLRQIGYERVSLIIVRYFGGTKLGLPRLKRTYEETAQLAVSLSEPFLILPGQEITLETDYSTYEKIKKEGLLQGYRTEKEEFSSSVRFSLTADATLIKSLEEALPPSSRIVTKTEVEILRSQHHDTQQ